MSTSDWTPFTHEWTTDDLDALPDDGIRRELIDGVLLVSPTPTSKHQRFAAKLMTLLEIDCPSDLAVTQATEMRVNRKRTFIPDVLVVTAEADASSPSMFSPGDVRLVIEIVSPSSVSMDTFLKPTLYAQAGIPHFWRIDLTPEFKVSAFDLDKDAGHYLLVGEFTEAIHLKAPFDIYLHLDSISQRPGHG